jgi:hypothetical protein
MGTVHLARSQGGRALAVEAARPEPAADPHFCERFRAEVEAARGVDGLHTVPVVNAGPDVKAPWPATAYIPGLTVATPDRPRVAPPVPVPVRDRPGGCTDRG